MDFKKSKRPPYVNANQEDLGVPFASGFLSFKTILGALGCDCRGVELLEEDALGVADGLGVPGSFGVDFGVDFGADLEIDGVLSILGLESLVFLPTGVPLTLGFGVVMSLSGFNCTGSGFAARSYDHLNLNTA